MPILDNNGEQYTGTRDMDEAVLIQAEKTSGSLNLLQFCFQTLLAKMDDLCLVALNSCICVDANYAALLWNSGVTMVVPLPSLTAQESQCSDANNGRSSKIKKSAGEGNPELKE